ncbi:hypothetical protein ACTWP5_22045, partial [Streptomyces sp. 4N509B]
MIFRRRGWPRTLDPLLPAAWPAPAPLPGDLVLTTRDGGSRAVYRRHRADPESFAACWTALDQHQLHARPHPDAPPAALDELLTAFDRAVAGAFHPDVPDAPDAEAVLTWPSRGTAATPVLLAHGLRPKVIAAARTTRRDGSPH